MWWERQCQSMRETEQSGTAWRRSLSHSLGAKLIWLLLGAMVVIFGTLTALVPSKLKLAYARTQVIGTTKKHEVLAQG